MDTAGMAFVVIQHLIKPVELRKIEQILARRSPW